MSRRKIDMAALEFGAWEPDKHTWSPARLDDWMWVSDPHRVTLAFAFGLMEKAKPQLVDFARDLPAELAGPLVDNLSNAATFFQDMRSVALGVLGRLECVSGVIDKEGDAA